MAKLVNLKLLLWLYVLISGLFYALLEYYWNANIFIGSYVGIIVQFFVLLLLYKKHKVKDKNMEQLSIYALEIVTYLLLLPIGISAFILDIPKSESFLLHLFTAYSMIAVLVGICLPFVFHLSGKKDK